MNHFVFYLFTTITPRSWCSCGKFH